MNILCNLILVTANIVKSIQLNGLTASMVNGLHNIEKKYVEIYYNDILKKYSISQ